MQATPDIHSYSDTFRRGPVARGRIPLLLSLLCANLVAAGVSPARAQVAEAAAQATAVSPDAIKQREQELETTRAEQQIATELQQKLKADLAEIGQDRSK